MSKLIYLFSISSHPKAKHINPLAITFFQAKVDFLEYDNFIITSKQITKILKFYEVKKEQLKPALCISKKSASSYEAIGGKVLEIGQGYGDSLIESIKKYPKEKKWLYLRAQSVASDFVKNCRDEGYTIDEEVLYESKCSQDIQDVRIEENAVLIFTSPSSVECYLKHHQFSKKHKVVVIGKTTLKKIPKDINVSLSKEKSIEDCIQLAESL